MDQNGQAITEKAFQGHPTALFFGFTHCPEICPTTLFEMDGWFEKLGKEGENIKAYFVLGGPRTRQRGNTQNLYFQCDQRVIGITGEPDKVAAMVKSFGVFARKCRRRTAATRWTIRRRCFCLNSAGDFHGTIAYGENPDNALEKMKRLIEAVRWQLQGGLR